MKREKKLITLAMLAAISVVLVAIIRFPMFLPYLEYDPADIPILIGGFMFGPLSGLLLAIVASAIQAITVSSGSGWIGFVMHVIATGGMVLVASIIYKYIKIFKNDYLRRLIGLILGCFTMTVLMMIMNLVLTPIFAQTTAKEIWENFMFTAIVPFNLVKSTINSTVVFLIFPVIQKITKKHS